MLFFQMSIRIMIENIYKLFCDEIDYFFNTSGFLHKDAKDIKDCGGAVEFAIRKFVQEVLGDRFKVCHGYIMGSSNNISPQVDLIIVDTLVPHRIKKFEYLADLQIVPVESVVGVFEIKRTLNEDSLKAANAHLLKIKESVNLPKGEQAQYLMGRKIEGNMKTGVYANPILGIIGGAHDFNQQLPEDEKTEWFVDVIFSVKGFLRAPTENDNDFALFENRCGPCKYKTITLGSGVTRGQILLLFVGFVQEYLNRTSGRVLNVNAYFSKKNR